MDTFLFVLVILIAYFLGNISPAIIIGKINGIDIKKEGSGNAGTTNVLRVMGKKSALITLTIDILKGVVAVGLGFAFSTPLAAMICACAAFVGHIWPICFGFNGGKGVAVAFGAVMAINWKVGLMALGIVAFGLLISKRMSVGSILGGVTFPILVYYMEPDFLYIGTVMAIILIFKHRGNIKRLVKGEEPRMSFKK
ncbi:MAG: glycerol-3-phosphate 1-O-acyltransferase PlsY [Eubacteriales bacterium]|nr:glycerol-3-phosphate 1-O-acyltransferase PlsY [Eubacteriales bacterium]